MNFRFLGSEDAHDDSGNCYLCKIFVLLKPNAHVSGKPAKMHYLRFLFIENYAIQQTITDDDIKEIFEKYGPVENVKRMDRASADVTFQKYKDAGSAMVSELKGENAMIANIIPVSTWRQPHPKIVPNEPSLLDLNDDCLLKIFGCCDFNARANLWKVSHRMRDLLEEYLLPMECTEYKITWTGGSNEQLLIRKRVHEELPYIGSHVKSLRLESFTDFTDEGHYPEPVDLTLQDCIEYVGASIDHLKLIRMPHVNQAMELIRPIVNKIESFTVQKLSRLPEDEFNIDIPNLKRLTMHSVLDISTAPSDFLQISSNLEELSIQTFISTVHQRLETFLKNIVNLKRLNIPLHHYMGLSDVIENLHNLEEIELDAMPRNILHCISPLLADMEVTQCLKNVLKMKNIRSLMLFASVERNGDDIFGNLNWGLSLIQRLYIRFDLSESVIIRIIEAAQHLRTLWTIPRVNKITYGFVKTLADARRKQFANVSGYIPVLEFVYSKRQRPQQHAESIPVFNEQMYFGAEICKYVKVEERPLSKLCGNRWLFHNDS